MTDTTFTVTNESYARWLQAQRPPFDWFHRQPVLAQESLAEQGAIHRIESMIQIGEAVRDPELFEAQTYATTDPEAEEVLVRRLAAKTVAEMVGSEAGQIVAEQPESAGGVSMAGLIQRRDEADAEQIANAGKGRSFLGRLPDSAREVEPSIQPS